MNIIKRLISLLLILLFFISGDGLTFYFHICKIDKEYSISLAGNADVHQKKADEESCHPKEHASCCHEESAASSENEIKGSSIRSVCCVKLAANNSLPEGNETSKTIKVLLKASPLKDYNIQPIVKKSKEYNLDYGALALSPHTAFQNKLISYIQTKSADKTDLPSLI